jgi:redox-sensitive bicupin YhaK (pirin superfamily)
MLDTNTTRPDNSSRDLPAVRPVAKIVRGMRASDGAGVTLHRSLGSPALPDVDPFLMLDEFRSDDPGDYLAGFPDHPHRGFETVTYMLAGRMRHSDNQGNSGLLGPGSVQWMTAGRGIVHSEMPEQEDGLMWGFQLWINLPSRDKMTAPRYQDIAPERIPVAQLPGGVVVKVIAGTVGEARGPVSGVATDPVYLDVSLPPGAGFAHEVPEGHAAFAYVFEGAVSLGGTRVERGNLAVLGPGARVEAAAGDGAGRFLLLAGKPLGEPVAKYGPFVMNKPEEIRQAIADFQAGRF